MTPSSQYLVLEAGESAASNKTQSPFARNCIAHGSELPAARRTLRRWSVGVVKKRKCESMDAEL
jgi:hypothetical protein